MAAVWFVVTIPTQSYEYSLLNDLKNPVNINVTCQVHDRNSLQAENEVDNLNGHVVDDKTASSSSLKPDCTPPDSSAVHTPLVNIHSNDISCDNITENILQNTLDELCVQRVSWSLTKNEKLYQVTFSASKNQCETILSRLTKIGIGSKPHTSLSVIPCTLYYDSEEKKLQILDSEKDSEDEIETEDDKTGERGLTWKKKSRKFLQSIKSRLTVAQVVEGVRESASLTFDFIVFVILAGMLAAMGLVEDSSVVLVASMLVSPMMGPILAGTFGTVIQDRALQRLGIKNELIGLSLCLLFGFIFGIIYGSSRHWTNHFWLTNEMVARGQLRSLWVGVLIALPSGAGVALSILGGNAGSLVGVAISASLLPPVVNAGLLWAVALTKYVRATLWESSEYLKLPETYTASYSNNTVVEACALGAVSLGLTAVNILCIFIMGAIVLKIKEVAPHTAISNTRRFWKRDIKVARDYNRTFKGYEAKTMGDRLRKEWEELQETEGIQDSEQDDEATANFERCLEEMEKDPVYRTVRIMSTYRPTKNLHQTCRSPMEKHIPEVSFREGSRRRIQRSLSNPSSSISSKPEMIRLMSIDNEVSQRNSSPLPPVTPSKRFLGFHFPKPTVKHRFTVTKATNDPLRKSGGKKQ